MKTNLIYFYNTMCAWISRRQEKGQEPTADEIWNHINKLWGNISETDREEIFQELGKRK